MKCSLIAKIESKGNLKGKLNNPTVYVYPEADKLDITPSEKIQKYEGYYNEINVSAIPTEKKTIEVEFTNSDNIEIEPSANKYLKKVTINKDENLIPDNIRKDVTISGIKGTMEGAWDSLQLRQCYNMFYGNTEMIEAPFFDTSNVTSMNTMFYGCTNLTKVPKYNTSKVTSMGQMFMGCSNLVDFPEFDTTNITGMPNICMYCSKLENFPVLNVPKVTSLLNILSGCDSLTDESLNNILQMCIGAVKITNSNYKRLRSLGLSEEQTERCKTLSNYQAFLDAGWITGY